MTRDREKTEAQLIDELKKLRQRNAELDRVVAGMREGEEERHALFQTMTLGVVFQDAQGSITSANPAAQRILGLTLDQLQGRTSMDPRWRSIRTDGTEWPGDEHPAMVSIRTGEKVQGAVMGVFHPPENTTRWIEIDSVPLFHNGENEPGQVYTTFTDITDRHRAQEERRSLEAQVQHSQKLESLGVLAGGIAHDFNNLMMTILGNVDLTLLDLSPDSPVLSNIREVEEAAVRAADLAKQMLAYSGKGSFIVAPLNVNEVVGEMAHLLESSISKKADLTTRLESSVPPIKADATQIRQVVMNLITNASEAIGEDNRGTITITTGVQECSRAYLATSYIDEKQPAGCYVHIEVTDTGCGMDERTKSRLFDPFFSTKFTGRGLGMAAALGIIRGHGGAIIVDSEPGEGSTFRVLFPAIAEEVRESAPTAVLPERDVFKGTGTVLVVDDEDSVRRLAVAMVERLGFETLQAADGQEGVEVFEKNADIITCVILDLKMPRMDGCEACLEIKKIREDVPVVLSSAYQEAELSGSGSFDDYGLAGFIRKPYSRKELSATLQRVLDARG